MQETGPDGVLYGTTLKKARETLAIECPAGYLALTI